MNLEFPHNRRFWWNMILAGIIIGAESVVTASPDIRWWMHVFSISVIGVSLFFVGWAEGRRTLESVNHELIGLADEAIRRAREAQQNVDRAIGQTDKAIEVIEETQRQANDAQGYANDALGILEQLKPLPDILEETRLALRAASEAKPPITDPTDQRIFDLASKAPDLSDQQIGQMIGGMARQNVNRRRNKLEAMGYKVR